MDAATFLAEACAAMARIPDGGDATVSISDEDYHDRSLGIFFTRLKTEEEVAKDMVQKEATERAEQAREMRQFEELKRKYGK